MKTQHAKAGFEGYKYSSDENALDDFIEKHVGTIVSYWDPKKHILDA